MCLKPEQTPVQWIKISTGVVEGGRPGPSGAAGLKGERGLSSPGAPGRPGERGINGDNGEDHHGYEPLSMALLLMI